MKSRIYIVWFSNCNYPKEFVEVVARCADDAIILAKAKRIKKGLDHTVAKVEVK